MCSPMTVWNASTMPTLAARSDRQVSALNVSSTGSHTSLPSDPWPPDARGGTGVASCLRPRGMKRHFLAPTTSHILPVSRFSARREPQAGEPLSALGRAARAKPVSEKAQPAAPAGDFR